MQFGVLHIGIDCHYQIPISPLSHQIFLFRFAIYLVGPRLFVGGSVLGVCLTSLGCVVAVYVVLVLAEDHSLVGIPEMGEEVIFKGDWGRDSSLTPSHNKMLPVKRFQTFAFRNK